MEASMQTGAGGARTQDLIATVSAISNSLMNEVSKVIIGKTQRRERIVGMGIEPCGDEHKIRSKTVQGWQDRAV